MARSELPIDTVLAPLLAALREGPSALLIAPVRGSFASVADGVSLYPFIIGILMFVVAPLVIWEAVRR